VLVLVTGMVLAPGKRTVSAVLRVMGLGETRDFALYHYVLSRARCSSRGIARMLLTMILDRFLPTGPVVIGIDDTIERRWGRKIAARGIYRDPVRSSHGHFVKTSGLRWLSLMAMVPVGLVTLPNIARNKSPGTSGSRRSDDFTPCLHGRCPEGSVRSC
jgi:hypothetical protein